MRRIIILHIATLCLLLLANATSRAQGGAEDVTQEKTVHRTANFNLAVVSGSAQAATVDAYYRSGSNSFVMWFDDKKKDSVNLTAPLNLQYFRTQVNAKFNSAYGNSGTDVQTLREETVMGLFYFLYTMQGDRDEDPPAAGDLYLGRYTMVFEDEVEAGNKDLSEREEILGKVDDELSAFRNNVNVADSAVVIQLRAQLKDVRGNKIVSAQGALTAHPMNMGFVVKYVRTVITAANIERMLTSFRTADYNLVQGTTSINFGPAIIPTDILTIQSLLQTYQVAAKALAKKKQDLQAKKIFAIRHITFKVERGFLEDVHVEVANDHGTTDWYDNIIPIGMSSLYNLKMFGLQRLFIRKPSGDYDNCIFLSDVIGNYDLWEELLTRDYAPGDTVLNRIDPNKNPFITLKRERFVHLFDSRIYTDLAGLDDKTPNGLVQIELSRRFNFLTNRLQYGGKRGDWGILNYIYLYGALTKIEDKLKRLPLRNALNVQNNTIVSPNYVTNLSLRQWENASLGLDLNAFLNNWKDGKTTLSLDLGARYGRTPIIDSLQRIDATGQLSYPTINDELRLTAHTITFFPRFKLEFISQRRVGFTLAYQWNHTILFSNNRFKQVASERKSDLGSLITEGQARRSHQIDLDVRVLTSRSSGDHLFFRGRFYFQQGDASTFFPQFQLGYNYNLVFKR